MSEEKISESEFRKIILEKALNQFVNSLSNLKITLAPAEQHALEKQLMEKYAESVGMDDTNEKLQKILTTLDKLENPANVEDQTTKSFEENLESSALSAVIIDFIKNNSDKISAEQKKALTHKLMAPVSKYIAIADDLVDVELKLKEQGENQRFKAEQTLNAFLKEELAKYETAKMQQLRSSLQ